MNEDQLTPEELAIVKARYPVSKDVETLSLGGASVPKSTGTIAAHAGAAPDATSSAQGINDNHATTHLRSSTAKARGKANLLDSDPGTDAKLERAPKNGAVGAVQVQARLGKKFLVRVTSVRKRLLDEDNLCEKYHVDLCRYSGALPKDSPGTAKIETGQQKADPGSVEETIIEIYEL